MPLETIDLMMTARQRNVGARKGVKAFNTFTQISSVLFTFAERMNRLVTFIAAARLAEKRAVKENAKRVLTGDALAESQLLRNWGAKSLAEWAVDESQYRMGKSTGQQRCVASALPSCSSRLPAAERSRRGIAWLLCTAARRKARCSCVYCRNGKPCWCMGASGCG